MHVATMQNIHLDTFFFIPGESALNPWRGPYFIQLCVEYLKTIIKNYQTHRVDTVLKMTSLKKSLPIGGI